MASPSQPWTPYLPGDVLPQSDGGMRLPLTAMVLTAMAAGTGWGIRGQYGHETGAMIAGTLASLTLVMLFVPRASSLSALRAAAMMTAAIGIGGSMTYGQTVGLTHDHELVGNKVACAWGMLGLFIKGGVWIGFGGILLGMGLSGQRYRPLEMTIVMAALVALFFVGVRYLNGPYDPDNHVLPEIYFSDSWDFEPDKVDVKPRRETWGGYWVALLALMAYTRLIRRDSLALRMGIFGVIAGGLGFAGGQCTQSLHAWHPELFAEDGVLGFMHGVTRYFNWWNIMETTFGCIWGAVVALGLYLNRHLIDVSRSDDDYVTTPLPVEILLVAVHLALVLVGEFGLPGFENMANDGETTVVRRVVIAAMAYAEIGLVPAAVPIIGIVGGRLWPYLMLMTIVAAPICGKTLRMASYSDGAQWPMSAGWISLVALTMLLCLAIGVGLILRSQIRQSGGRAAAIALAATSLLYFGLNTVFFNFAWPWDEWTGRTPNQIFFMVSTICLLLAVLMSYFRSPPVSRLSDLRR